MKHALGIFIVLPMVLMFALTVSGMDYIFWFIDAPTLFVFMVVLFAVYFTTGEFRTFVKTANAIFSKKYVISEEDVEKGLRLLALSGKVINYTAVFQVLGALIIILGTLDDPANIGPMLAITFVSALYAAMLQICFILPSTHILKNRVNRGTPTST
ncbi:MAG: hypothetical protein FWB96_00145 [Defluviitaleaceae bacterium]|nr:hypothetical protein [Defluviitaleaceae bacterium]MCL2262548.1 hypothetical protein [Defluviitaleaceae bacterium]